nr:hypothetical protein PHYPA_017790 [Physcomitrium patens]
MSAPTTMGSCDRPRNCLLGVTLRHFTAEDMKLSLKWFGDDEVTVTTPNDSFQSEGEAQRYFATNIAGHPWYRLICVDGEPAGAIYLTLNKGAHRVRGDVSYILAKEYWGKGVMTEANALAVKAGFTEFGLHRIQAYTLPTNIGSQRVLEKCGFQREGLLRNFVRLRGKLSDVFVFAICRDDQNVDESGQ